MKDSCHLAGPYMRLCARRKISKGVFAILRNDLLILLFTTNNRSRPVSYLSRNHLCVPDSQSNQFTMSILPVLLLAFAFPAYAHEHHDELTEAQANAPIDAILWIHIFLQAAVWGVLFPIGMVLGMSRSRWHVPLQVRDFNNYNSSRGVDSGFRAQALH